MIEINNLTKQKINPFLIKKFIAQALKILKIKKSISLVFVGLALIKKINEKYRQKNEITDILSFIGADNYLGEIIISLKQAQKQAKQAQHSLMTEIKILIIHGILHLHGYDHHYKKDYKLIVKKEKQLLKILKV
ncbi:MAG: rRNA maturation RNase YbeY [Ignavibacterium sp.]|nr:rRNA maturation RNase YbeY [Ignavibacterium sp.]